MTNSVTVQPPAAHAGSSGPAASLHIQTTTGQPQQQPQTITLPTTPVSVQYSVPAPNLTTVKTITSAPHPQIVQQKAGNQPAAAAFAGNAAIRAHLPTVPQPISTISAVASTAAAAMLTTANSTAAAAGQGGGKHCVFQCASKNRHFLANCSLFKL